METRTEDIDLFSRLSEESNKAIQRAIERAIQFDSPYVDPEFLFLALLDDLPTVALLENQGLDLKLLKERVTQSTKAGEFHGKPELSQRAKLAIKKSLDLGETLGQTVIEPPLLLWGTLQDEALNKTLKDVKINLEQINQDLEKIYQTRQAKGPPEESAEKPTQGVEKALNRFTTDLTAKAKMGALDPVIGRETEIQRIIEILIRRTKNNPVLIGEAGVGKTAVVEGLAQQIAKGNVPELIKNKKVLMLDLMLLISGAKHRGEFEERLEALIKEIKAAAGTIILFIDELHNVIGAGGGEGAIDASNILKPPLSRGEIQVIGATTIQDYRQRIEKDPAFERRFQKVLIAEPDEVATLEILKGLRSKYEEHHQVKILDDALEAAVRLSKRFIADRFLPDKAIDLIDEAASKVQIKKGKEVKADSIEQIVSQWTGIPVGRLTEDEAETLLQLENRIHQRLINQERAVTAVAEAIRRNRAGLKNPKRPIGSFIFLGPTGVGKTELSKTLAEVLFGDEDLMIRMDMSEYMEKNAVARMIGAPPGYIGYEEGGQLTEAVRRKPYSVLLFDEIEKANPDVFNIFLQILEDGRLTDGKGRTIDFKNTIIICTSNIGTQLIKTQNIEDPVLPRMILAELLKFFNPEFINRFDEIVVFRALTPQDMSQIVNLMIKDLSKRLAEQKITLSITPEAAGRLAELGFDPVYGARPLRRVIQQLIENPLSSELIRKSLKPGEAIEIDWQGKDFLFNRRSGESQASPAPRSPAEGEGKVGSPPFKPPVTAQPKSEPPPSADLPAGEAGATGGQPAAKALEEQG